MLLSPELPYHRNLTTIFDDFSSPSLAPFTRTKLSTIFTSKPEFFYAISCINSESFFNITFSVLLWNFCCYRKQSLSVKRVEAFWKTIQWCEYSWVACVFRFSTNEKWMDLATKPCPICSKVFHCTLLALAVMWACASLAALSCILGTCPVEFYSIN